jgi:uncharacterized protein (TIGR04255 family)
MTEKTRTTKKLKKAKKTAAKAQKSSAQVQKSSAKAQKASKTALESKVNPVLEVIVEAQFSASEWTEKTPSRLHDLLAKRLPNIEIRGLVGAVGATRVIEGGTVVPFAPEIQMWNEERTELLQLGPRVIIANCLRYSSWDTFARFLEAGINAYLEVVAPARIENLSFRIINQFDLGADEGSDVALDKFFGLYAGLPKGFREIDGLQISFQTTLKPDKTHAKRAGVNRTSVEHTNSPIRLEVELRSASGSDLTALADGMKSESSRASSFLLDIDASCACEGEPRADLICAISEQLRTASMNALRSMVRPALLKKYHWQE